MAFAADATSQREQEWNRAVRAAEQEGELVLSALSEVGEVFTHGGFQKKFPKIKLNVVPALRLLRINSGGHPGDGQRPSYRWKTVSRLRGWTPVFTGVTIRRE